MSWEAYSPPKQIFCEYMKRKVYPDFNINHNFNRFNKIKINFIENKSMKISGYLFSQAFKFVHRLLLHVSDTLK